MNAPSSPAPSAAAVNAIKEKAKLLSIYSMMATTAAGSGHPTSCMSAAELVAGVFFHAMKFDPKNANSNDDDRFVLSKGHAAPVLYAALAEAGVFPVSRVMTLREFASELEGHPTPRIHGVDAATGSLGQGLSVGSGLAIGARMDKSPTRVYVLTGDGELAEGQIWEAAAFAAHYNLDNLTVIADINRLGQSEPTMYQHDMERYRLKFESEGFDTQVIDGHDVAAVLVALDRAKMVKGRPQAIVARTLKGHGFSLVADKLNWHGKPLSKEQLAAAIREGAADRRFPPIREHLLANVAAETGRIRASRRAGLRNRRQSGDAGSIRFCAKRLGAASAHVVAISGDVKNSTFSEISGTHILTFLARIHRRAEHGECRGRTAGARQDSVCRHVRLFPFARLRQCAHGGCQPREHQPVRVALRRLDRRRRAIADGAGGYRHVPRGAWLGGFLIRATRSRPSA